MPAPFPDPFSGLAEGIERGMRIGLLRRQMQLEEQKTKELQDMQRWKKNMDYVDMQLKFAEKLGGDNPEAVYQYLNNTLKPEYFQDTPEIQGIIQGIKDLPLPQRKDVGKVISEVKDKLDKGNLNEVIVHIAQLEALNTKYKWGIDKTINEFYSLLGAKREEEAFLKATGGIPSMYNEGYNIPVEMRFGGEKKRELPYTLEGNRAAISAKPYLEMPEQRITGEIPILGDARELTPEEQKRIAISQIPKAREMAIAEMFKDKQEPTAESRKLDFALEAIRKADEAGEKRPDWAMKMIGGYIAETEKPKKEYEIYINPNTNETIAMEKGNKPPSGYLKAGTWTQKEEKATASDIRTLDDYIMQDLLPELSEDDKSKIQYGLTGGLNWSQIMLMLSEKQQEKVNFFRERGQRYLRKGYTIQDSLNLARTDWTKEKVVDVKGGKARIDIKTGKPVEDLPIKDELERLRKKGGGK